MIIFSAGWYLSLMLFVHTTHPAAGIPFLMLAGLSQGLSQIAMATMLIRNCDEQFRGRIMGITHVGDLRQCAGPAACRLADTTHWLPADGDDFHGGRHSAYRNRRCALAHAVVAEQCTVQCALTARHLLCLFHENRYHRSNARHVRVDGVGQATVYPVKLVRIVNPVAAGGNQDIVARAYAEQFSRNLGQQFVVESRPGNSAIVGTRFVKNAPADGYTLLAISNTFARTPIMIKDAGYDPLKDFAAITVTSDTPQVLVINPALPVRTVKELIALAKQRPGEISSGSSGSGSTGHVAAEMFAAASRHTLVAHSVQGCSTRRDRSDWRPRHAALRSGEHVDRTYPLRQTARTRRHQQQALRAVARRADYR
jgi:hypothetical protein